MATRPLALIVFCTCPDQQTGEMLAREAVEQKLAACVNIIPGLTSIFEWDGAIETETEVLLLAKTSADAYGALENLWKSRHPYELPEVVAVSIETGSEAYLQWIKQALTR